MERRAQMRLGNYELVGLLATGGMAELYLARPRAPKAGFDRPLAVKRILPHLAREPVFRDMFLDEARVVAQIRHPNVVSVHELGEEGGALFLAMEYLEGESLSTVAKRLAQSGGRLPDRVILHILSDACSGLHAAHELHRDGRSLGVVHRDVSPHNLFVLYTGQTKVIDFGIAKGADRASRTNTGMVKGKFAYMAPEQIQAHEVDRRADVFALGIVLFELLTGKPLFARDNDLLVMQAICIDPVPDILAERPDLDPEVVAIVTRALARSPEDRYPTAAALRRDVIAVLSRMSVGAGEPVDEHLARILAELFSDRIRAKREMLTKVHEGGAVSEVATSTGSAPLLLGLESANPSSNLTVVPTEVERSRHPKPRAARWLPVTLLVGGLALGVVLSVVFLRAPEPPVSARTPPEVIGSIALSATSSAPEPVVSPSVSAAPVESTRPPAVPSAAPAVAASSPPPAFQPKRAPGTTPGKEPSPAPTADFGRFD